MTIRRNLALLVTALLVGSVGLTACGGPEPGAPADTTLTIATVDNGDMQRLQELSDRFTQQNPGTTLEWVVLDENQLRQEVTTDIATGSGRFDIVTLGTYESTIWAERDWLLPLDGLDSADVIPNLREVLTHDGRLIAAPFYGESSFTMYRTDLFAAAGLTMPAQPTWDFITDAAARLNGQGEGTHGICLRGRAGWGENVAAVTAMANSYGGRWFDEQWQPQLTSPQWKAAVGDYLELSRSAPPTVAANGFSENLDLFRDGDCAIWVDATSAASFVTDPTRSAVAGSVGFAPAPGTGLDRGSNWLWSWALAIPRSSEKQEAARAFLAWATSPGYTELVAQEYGWLNVPPGVHRSLYDNPAYLAAAPFAPLVLTSIESADPERPTVEPVPYTGVQYVAIPEFQSIGTAVGNQLTQAITGELDLDTALSNSNWVAAEVLRNARYIE